MNRRLLIMWLTALFVLVVSSAAQAATGPLYDVHTSWGDTNLPPGDDGQFAIQIRNIGDQNGKGPLTVVDELPAGVKATQIAWPFGMHALAPEAGCSGIGTETVQCVLPEFWVSEFSGHGLAQAAGTKVSNGLGEAGAGGLNPNGYLPLLFIDVAVDPGVSGTDTNTATVSGGGAIGPAFDADQVSFAQTPARFGLLSGSYRADVYDAAYPFGSAVRQAGDHPFEQRVGFDFNAGSSLGSDGTRYISSHGLVRTVEVTLPRGMIGNPEAMPKCDPVDFAEEGSTIDSTACPADTQVGYLNVLANAGEDNHGQSIFYDANEVGAHIPIYNLKPPQGTLADLAFNAGSFVQGHIYGTVDPARHYAIKTVTPNISSVVKVLGSEVTIWGVPGDPAHDKFRYYPESQGNNDVAGAPFGSAPIRPFLTNPMDCGEENGGATITLDSYTKPGQFSPVQEYGNPLDVEGCNDVRFRFEPDVALHPTSRDAGGPTGLDVNLKLPQRNDEAGKAEELYAQNGFVKGISTPPIKKVVVTLPKGMTVSPSAAQGLEACTPAQIGIDPKTGTPNDAPVTCPDASQYGTLRLKSPALPQSKTIEGRVYVAQPYTNQFGSFLALYLAIEDQDLGLRVKLAGKVELDPQTGQITTEFDDLPQLPTSEVEMKVKGGLRAGLVNPQTCGTKTIEATFYSWQERNTPYTVKNSYDITEGPGGTPCFDNLSERPFDPQLQAETLNPLAGAFAPLFIRLTRTDADQDLSVVDGTAPPGLLASLRGTARCSDAQIAAAADPARTGTEELGSPSCPASSQVGTVDAGAGVGQVLTYVKGKVYLAGPYKGAPLSGVAIVPAVAGPFDLGTVVTRAPAYVDPETAQLTLKTDPLPLIFKGVPVRVRDVRVHLDRPDFTLNPTNCAGMHIGATLFSSEGKSKDASNRFQVGSCADLGFKPRLSLRLSGGTERGSHPSLRAEVRPRAGDANIRSAAVSLPHSAFLDQAHIRTICTRVQFAVSQCPAGSIYGHARAFTPLLDEPLEGPVYLRSSSHSLPDVVVALRGPASLPIEFNLAGRVDSIHGGIRNTFESTPDAPVSKFVLELSGGKKGLIINSTDLCARAHRATAKLNAQNGRRSNSRPKVVAAGCGKRHKHAKRSRQGAAQKKR